MEFPHLDIIIPQYSETEEMIKPLLTSIENQVGLNYSIFNVTIVNDHGEHKLSKEFLDSFMYPINYIETDKNGGPGYARQWGIDHTSNPLIMFCDADDRLFSIRTLMEIYQWIRLNDVRKKEWNMLVTDFYEEQFIGTQGYNILEHKKPTMVWMHGKVWKRAFIEKYNIRFHSTLRSFEDTYFGKCYQMLCGNTVGYLEYFTYFWKRNPNSITSHWTHDGKDYMYWENDSYIISNRDSLKFLYPLMNKSLQWKSGVYVSVYFTYMIEQCDQFRDGSDMTAAKIKAMRDFVAETIKLYGADLNEVSYASRQSVYNDCRNSSVQKIGFKIEHQLVKDWLNEIASEYNVDITNFKICED